MKKKVSLNEKYKVDILRTCNDILASWKKLNAKLFSLTESEVATLLQIERSNKRRMMVIRRLHQRLNKLRVTREREELRKNP